MNRPYALAGLTLIALLAQCLCIGWLIFRYERILRHGTEIRIRCSGEDPLDAFRGAFLRLRVRAECDNVSLSAEESATLYQLRRSPNVIAKLEQEPDSTLFRVTRVTDSPPEDNGLWIKPTDFFFDFQREPPRELDEDDAAWRIRKRRIGLRATILFPNNLFVNKQFAERGEKLLQEHADDAVAVYRIKDNHILLVDVELAGSKSLLKTLAEPPPTP